MKELRSLQHQIINVRKKVQKRPYTCLFVEEGAPCAHRAIKKSHAIQRKGPLRAIADDTNHLYGFEYNLFAMDSHDFRILKRIGISKASTFQGFCEEHDRRIFTSFETGLGPLSVLDVAKMTYRAICMEVYLFLEEMRGNDEMVKSPLAALRRAGKRLRDSDFYEGRKIAYRDLKLHKMMYERAIAGEMISNYSAVAFRLETPLPFCFVGASAPAYDFDDKLILPNEGEVWDRVGFIAGQFNDGYYVVLGGFNLNTSHDLSMFFKSALRVNPLQLGNLAFFLSVRYAHKSAFFSTTWIDSFTNEFKQELGRMVMEIFPGHPAHPGYMFSNTPSVLDVRVAEVKAVNV